MNKPTILTTTLILLTITLIPISTSASCLSNETLALSTNLYNSTGSQINITPLITDLESICNTMILLNTENSYQSTELLRLNSSLTNHTILIPENATLTQRVSLIESNITNIDASIQNLIFNITNPISANFTLLTTTQSSNIERLDDIENLYITTGTLKLHNDTMNKHIEEQTQSQNLTYVYIAIFILLTVVVATTILNMQPQMKQQKRGV